MNGVSLFLVLAAVGVSAQIEPGPGGVPTYTIRIESLLLDQLRRGEVLEQSVAARDRLARRFRIMVTPDKGIIPRSSIESASRSDALGEYEAVLHNNDVEMWVQLAPDRVELLAQGRSIEGELPPDAEVTRFRVFVGVGKLPRQQPIAAQPPSSAPSYLLTGAETTGGDARTVFDPRSTASAPRPGQPIGSASLGAGSRALAGSPAANARINDARPSYRNSPDQSSVAPPPDRYPLHSTSSGQSFGADPRTSPTVGGYAYDVYSQQPAYDRQPTPGYGAGAVTQFAQAQQPSAEWGSAGFSPAQPMIAARPADNQPAPTVPAAPYSPSYSHAPLAASNPAPVHGHSAAAAPPGTVSTAAAAPAMVVRNDDNGQARSSTPLILTTLALFTSLGVNTYLGWLAYSFFWRYRDAVNDSLRIRSQNSPGRQAA